MSTADDLKAQYRKTIGLFATGVTVVLAEKGDEVRGMTANSVSSVSLDPTLILFCPSKQAHLSDYIDENSHFSINILGDHQEDISNYFAGALSEENKPDFTFERWNDEAAPRLAGAIGAISCKVHQIHDGGDHWIVVGEVLDLHQSDDNGHWPLLFFSGQYHHPSRVPGDAIMPETDPYS